MKAILHKAESAEGGARRGRGSRANEQLIERVFELDRRIRFCGVVNQHGKLEAGGMRPGVKAMEPHDQTAGIVLQTAVGSKAFQASESHIGRARYGIIRRDRLVQIVFALPKDRELQIATTASFPINKVELMENVVKKFVSPFYYQ